MGKIMVIRNYADDVDDGKFMVNYGKFMVNFMVIMVNICGASGASVMTFIIFFSS